jgi:predicted regulator of Ras-like GTPase activity (Roadblock/LC7/MglB family)
VASGLTSLTQGAARCFGGGAVEQIIVELQAGYMFFMAINAAGSLAVLSTKQADVGLVGYEMTMLCRRVGTSLTPQLVAEMQAALPKE